MSTHPSVEAWEREHEAKGFAEALLLTYEARFGDIPPELREIVAQTRDRATLRAWQKLVASDTADAFAEAVRQSRAA